MFELKKYLAVAGIIGSLFIAVGCGSSQDNQDQSAAVQDPPSTTTSTLPPIRPTRPEDVAPRPWKDIDARAAEQFLSNGSDIQIIDVREGYMFSNKHIKGAIWIPINKVEEGLTEVDKNRPVLVYDDKGESGHRAIDVFVKHGYKNLYYLSGGMSTWTYEIEP